MVKCLFVSRLQPILSKFEGLKRPGRLKTSGSGKPEAARFGELQLWFCKRGAVLECETLVEHECMPVSTCTKVGADEGLATAH